MYSATIKKYIQEQGSTCEKPEGKANHPQASGLRQRAILLLVPSSTPVSLFLLMGLTSSPPSLPCTCTCRWSSGFCHSCYSADAHSTIATSASEAVSSSGIFHQTSQICPPLSTHATTPWFRHLTLATPNLVSVLPGYSTPSSALLPNMNTQL